MLLYALKAAAFNMTTVAYDSHFFLHDTSSPYQLQDCELYRLYSCSCPAAFNSVTYNLSMLDFECTETRYDLRVQPFKRILTRFRAVRACTPVN